MFKKMSAHSINGLNDMLEELSKIEYKMRKLNSTKNLINGYIAYMEKECPEDVMKEVKKGIKKEFTNVVPKEPSKEDFKTTCDSLLKQLKEARIKIDELTDENRVEYYKRQLRLTQSENKRLKMENELMRDFLSLTGRE